MTRSKKLLTVAAVGLAGIFALSGCAEGGSPVSRDSQLQDSEAAFAGRTAPDVTGDAEYNNYIKAQEDVYDNPASIIWCTSSFPNDASPIFTVPIAGKLTSSSVSYYPGSTQKFSGGGSFTWTEENQSVDGMYHGSPGPYRYGFTPGGQYFDFTGMAVLCTTALTEFQRQTLTVATVDSEAESLTAQAEELLKAGDTAGAQAILDGLVN